MIELESVLGFLGRRRLRATYKAVGEVIGVGPREVSRLLGPRSPAASWVVNATSGMPTGYRGDEKHPALEEQDRILRSGAELLSVMAESSAHLFRNQAFSVSHADDSPFRGQGLRPFFEYRDLGIAGATGGAVVAHVIRAVPGRHSEAAWHVHDLDFQMVYVTRGWVVFEYQGQGEQILRAGSCVLQPSGICHREVRHSDDMELIEIVSPATFGTRPVEKPDSGS